MANSSSVQVQPNHASGYLQRSDDVFITHEHFVNKSEKMGRLRVFQGKECARRAAVVNAWCDKTYTLKIRVIVDQSLILGVQYLTLGICSRFKLWHQFST